MLGVEVAVGVGAVEGTVVDVVEELAVVVDSTVVDVVSLDEVDPVVVVVEPSPVVLVGAVVVVAGDGRALA